MDLSVSGPDGKPVRPIIGSGGHDHRGLPTQGDGVPAAVAPFEAVVVVAQQDDAAGAGMGEQGTGGCSTRAWTRSSATARCGRA